MFGGSNGEKGVTVGPCFLGGSLCAFDFVSQVGNYRQGIGLMRRVGSTMYTVRWYITQRYSYLTLSDWAFSSVPSALETWSLDPLAINTGAPFPVGCADNYLLFGSASAIKASIVVVFMMALLCLLSL